MEEEQEAKSQSEESGGKEDGVAAPSEQIAKRKATEIARIRQMRPAIIAIDGPAGAGKSTIGHDLAHLLDFLFFDTGIMYRAVTWAALDAEVNLHDAHIVGKLAQTIAIHIIPVAEHEQALIASGIQCHVQIDGVDVTAQLRTPLVERNVSIVSAHHQVREALCEQQRRIGLHYGTGNAEKGGIVMAGRDIGTVVLPDAPLKIYMVASLAERARRRYNELQKKGKDVTLPQVLQEMERRDTLDSKRALSPLRPADDAIEVDTSQMDALEVVATVIALAADHLMVE